jgi:DNA (cytosine-5)-methyltransferase 1
MHTTFKYATVCSGIEAPTVAWHPLGWEPVWFSQYDPEHNYERRPDFASRLLQHYYPNTPNLGDMLQIDGTQHRGTIDLICGGTPCQSFSIAGLRNGLADERGNLSLQFVRLVDQIHPRWFVWENVPGVLSSNGGRDFGSIIGAMAHIGYKCAWRVLDAQYFGVPQRRRRVFVVGHIADWRYSAAVLFEPKSLYRNFETAQRQKITGAVADDFGECSEWPVMATGQSGAEIAIGQCTTLTKNHEAPILFAPQIRATQNFTTSEDLSPTIGKQNGYKIALTQHQTVRRITPLEAERLQGFPDGYTDIPGASDTARYAALGNSMAVPVMHWIGKRINIIENIKK